jgi:hypothetical protein
VSEIGFSKTESHQAFKGYYGKILIEAKTTAMSEDIIYSSTIDY